MPPTHSFRPPLNHRFRTIMRGVRKMRTVLLTKKNMEGILSAACKFVTQDVSGVSTVTWFCDTKPAMWCIDDSHPREIITYFTLCRATIECRRWKLKRGSFPSCVLPTPSSGDSEGSTSGCIIDIESPTAVQRLPLAGTTYRCHCFYRYRCHTQLDDLPDLMFFFLPGNSDKLYFLPRFYFSVSVHLCFLPVVAEGSLSLQCHKWAWFILTEWIRHRDATCSFGEKGD